MSLFDDLLTQSAPVVSPANPVGSDSTSPTDDPLSTPASSSIIITESTPMISVIEEVVIVPQTIPIPVAPIVDIPTDNSSILISDVSSSSPVTIASPAIDLPPAPTIMSETLVAVDPVVTIPPVSSSLFDMTDSPIMDPVQPMIAVASPTPLDMNMTRDTVSTPYHDTHDYIDHAISEVGTLIATIDAEDATTLAAEEEHRKQKEYYANLELADEAAHQKHLEERAHAEKMQKYLQKEQGIVNNQDAIKDKK